MSTQHSKTSKALAAKTLSTPPSKIRIADGTDTEVDCFTVEEFCRRNRISPQLFYKWPELMPVSFLVATRRLITREAAARWREERERLAAEAAS